MRLPLKFLEPRIVGFLGFRVFGVALAYCLALLLARVLGPADFGTYSLVVMAVTLVAIPLAQGWNTVVLRSVSSSDTQIISSETQALLIWGRRLSLGWAAVISLFAVLAALWFGVPLWIVVPFVLAVYLRQNSAYRMALLRGKGYPILNQIPEIITQPLIIGLAVAAMVYLANQAFGWEEVFTSYAIALIIAYTLGLIVQARITAPMTREPADLAGFDLGRNARNAIVIGGNAFVFTLSTQIDTYILAALGDQSDVGLYRFAMQLALIGGFVYTSLNYVAAAEIGKHWAQEDRAGMRQLSRKYSILSTLACLAFIAGILLFGEWFVRITVGPAFAGASYIAVVVLVGQLVNASVGMAANILTMTGHERLVIAGTIIGVGVSAILSLLLVPKLGVYGAAIAQVSGLTVLNLFYLVQCIRKIGVNPSAFGR